MKKFEVVVEEVITHIHTLVVELPDDIDDEEIWDSLTLVGESRHSVFQAVGSVGGSCKYIIEDDTGESEIDVIDVMELD